jgi:hypothetical protein
MPLCETRVKELKDLSVAQAREILRRDGPNELPSSKSNP